MEILEAYDLTGSLRAAAELAGCSHHTVARYVAAREAGGRVENPAVRPQLIDEFLPRSTSGCTVRAADPRRCGLGIGSYELLGFTTPTRHLGLERDRARELVVVPQACQREVSLVCRVTAVAADYLQLEVERLDALRAAVSDGSYPHRG